MNQSAIPFAAHAIPPQDRPDAAEELISRLLIPIKFVRVDDVPNFQLLTNGKPLKRIFFGYNQFATETVVDAKVAEEAVILGYAANRRKPSFFEIDDARITSSPETATVISPGRRIRIRRPNGAGMIGTRISRSVLSKQLEDITGLPIRADLALPPEIDLTKGIGRVIREAMGAISEALEQSRIGEVPLATVLYEDVIISAVLAASGVLQEVEPGNGHHSPRIVREAEEFMAARASEPITLSHVARQCACSRSALYQAFKSSRDYTPIQFLTLRRLELARQKLREHPDASVTSVALEFGFGNHGRFAKAYRSRFGELPSDTRAKRSESGRG